MAGFEKCEPDYWIERRRFPFYAIEYVIGGRGLAILDGVRLPLKSGVLFAYGPETHCVLRSSIEAPLSKYYLSLTGNSVDRRMRRCGLNIGRSILLNSEMDLRYLFEDILAEGRRTGHLARTVCLALLDVILLKIEASHRSSPIEPDPSFESFQRCKELIDREALSLSSLSEIADGVGVDRSTVCRWFRRYEGLGPYQYLLHRKMHLAAEYLLHEGVRVREVGYRVGFEDPYHFSRCFKAVHGIPPIEMQKIRRGH
ncbi:MAG: helix-turn-helix transcriptional regulator [Opitutales bacterium]|nr:helix-turn-helix transcriptional regulator [Opitutales bacterium]